MAAAAEINRHSDTISGHWTRYESWTSAEIAEVTISSDSFRILDWIDFDLPYTTHDPFHIRGEFFCIHRSFLLLPFS